MSNDYGASIVRLGLVFAYDMGNDKKSWKGAPTTNYLNGSTSGTYPDAFQVVSYAGDGARSEVGTSKFGTNIIQWTATGSTYIYTQDQILDDDLATLSGQTVTFSLYIRRLEGSATGRIRVYDNISSYSYQSVSVTSDFQRVEMTKTLGANPTRIFVMLDNTGGGTYQFHSPQLEISSFATPFTYSSRSNTEAIIDWTGNNTITANSLTYNSDGTFSFVGVGGVGVAGDYISCGNSSAINFGTGNFTLSFIAYRSSTGYQGGSYVSKGDGTSLGFDFRDSTFYIYGTTGLIASMGFSPTLNVWQQHDFVFDRASSPYIKYYLNGVYNSSSNTNNAGNIAASINTSRNLDIARSQAGGVQRYFNGSMPAVKLYNRALTAAEVQQNFNALRGRYSI